MSVPSAQRPHMVMLVNNAVVGDSRVVESADSASRAGYRVTIVGLNMRTSHPMGHHGQALIYRAERTSRHHEAWKARRAERIEAVDVLVDSRGQEVAFTQAALRSRSGASQLTKRIPWVNPFTNAIAEVSRKAQIATKRPRAKLRELAQRATAAGPGRWRRIWPHTVDHEEMFLKVLMQLEPDVVHCHDYHPMPGIASYKALLQRRGIDVPWVYDAHEWLPGQNLPGAKQSKIGWLAAEAELISQADAVISVSEELAGMMKRRHALRQRPTVVVNAPIRQFAPMDPNVRQPLREECGLEPDVPLLVYVGKLSELRGIFTLIDSLPLLPDAHVAFVGSNSPDVMAAMSSRARQLGVADRMHLLPYVPAESVTWYVASADVGISPLLPTPAHHSALPTKIREYLHARLPIVASDMKAQGTFVRNERVGEVHTPGDAASLASAVERVLEQRSHYERLFTDEFLDAHSWDHQEKKLASLWHRLCPTKQSTSRRPALSDLDSFEPPDSASSGGAVLAVPTARADGLAVAEAWMRAKGPVISLGPASRLNLEASLERWAMLEEYADKALFSAAANFTNGFNWMGLTGEARALRAMDIAVGSHMGDAAVLSRRELLSIRPDHPAKDWSRSQIGSYDRAVRLSTRHLIDSGIPMLTHSWNAAQTSSAMVYLPPVARVDDSLRSIDDAEAFRVMVLPVSRDPAEEEALAELEPLLRERGITLERPRGRGFAATSARGVDVLIAGLVVSDVSTAVAQVLASGGIVVADASPASSLNAAGVPVVAATPQTVSVVVLELVREFSTGLRAEREEGLEYARASFAGPLTAQVIDDVLS